MKKCKVCKKGFYPHDNRIGRFCSRGCYYDFIRSKQRADVSCATCKKKFSTRKRNQKNFFCSRECYRKFSTGKNHPQWRGGHDYYRGPKWKNISRAKLCSEGWYCIKCHAGGDDTSVKMIVDHVIPSRLFAKEDFEVMNHMDNLVVLCNQCHGLKTSTIERRLLMGDFLGLKEFYGQEIYDKAMDVWNS